jgi:hypothetical protein
MNQLLLAFCLGLLPALVVVLIIDRKVSRESRLLRERLAAEEASKRHFMDLFAKKEETIALMHHEQKRLELENTLLRSRAPGDETA